MKWGPGLGGMEWLEDAKRKGNANTQVTNNIFDSLIIISSFSWNIDPSSGWFIVVVTAGQTARHGTLLKDTSLRPQTRPL